MDVRWLFPLPEGEGLGEGGSTTRENPVHSRDYKPANAGGVNTRRTFPKPWDMLRGMQAMNPVETRIWELASFELGQRKKIIRKVRRREVIPNRRYSWLLFEKQTDPEPFETVVLDASLTEALKIDQSVGAELDVHLWV